MKKIRINQILTFYKDNGILHRNDKNDKILPKGPVW